MLDELRKPYVQVARSKGIPEAKIIFKYPTRIALNPVISTIGYILLALTSMVGLVVCFGTKILPLAGRMVSDDSFLSHLYLARAFPDIPPTAISLAFIMTIVIYQSVFLCALYLIIDGFNLWIILQTDRHNIPQGYDGMGGMFLRILFVILFAGLVRQWVVYFIVHGGKLIASLLGIA